MATARVRGAGGRTSGATPPRIEIEYLGIDDIVPYAWNPRDNREAIDSVANSISTFGFLIPVVVDAENTLVCGHTRVEAAKRLNMGEVPAVRVTHLTEDQLVAFRIIDNKLAELAKWDFDLLPGEITKLRDSGLTLTDFGYTQGELDCLSDMVADDCLSADGLLTAEDHDRIRRTERRAPTTTRIVVGEIVFFIPSVSYREWIDELRAEFDYQEEAIVAELKRRLEIDF